MTTLIVLDLLRLRAPHVSFENLSATIERTISRKKHDEALRVCLHSWFGIVQLEYKQAETSLVKFWLAQIPGMLSRDTLY